jgi:hypothetical protein
MLTNNAADNLLTSYCNEKSDSNQITDFGSYPLGLQDWSEKGWLYQGRNKVFYQFSKLTPLDPDRFIRNINEGNHIGLYTKNSNAICVDIDSVSTADSFVQMMKGMNVLIIRTPRGGIHAYFRKNQNSESIGFSNTYKVKQLGVIVEFKSSSW